MVEKTGFEPAIMLAPKASAIPDQATSRKFFLLYFNPTLWSQTRCATRLRYYYMMKNNLRNTQGDSAQCREQLSATQENKMVAEAGIEPAQEAYETPLAT